MRRNIIFDKPHETEQAALNIVVRNAKGKTKRTLDLRNTPTSNGLFHSLGMLECHEQSPVYINNHSSLGSVILDAV